MAGYVIHIVVEEDDDEALEASKDLIIAVAEANGGWCSDVDILD